MEGAWCARSVAKNMYVLSPTIPPPPFKFQFHSLHLDYILYPMCLSLCSCGNFYSWLRQENRNSAGVPNEKPYRRLEIMWSSPWLKYLHSRPPIALNVFMRPLRHDMGTLNIPFRPLALKKFPLISSLSSSFRLTLLSPFESSYPSWHSHPIRQNRTYSIGTLILRKRF